MPQMLKCFCNSTGCAGCEVLKRVFDTHSRLDRAAQAWSFWAYFEWSRWNPFSLSISNDTVRQISQHLGGQFWSKSSSNEESTERISHIMKGLAGVNSLTVTYNFFKILKSPWMNCRLMQNINCLLLGFPQDILPSLWSLLLFGFLTFKISLLV